VPAWETYYLLHGGQETAAKLVDASGEVVEQYEYDPYGRATVFSKVAGQWTSGGVSRYGLPFLWKAVRLDEVTGLLQMRNRYYSVETGRFLTRDPIGVWGDLGNLGNEAHYAASNPLLFSDALGLQSETRSPINMRTPGGHEAEVWFVDAALVAMKGGKPLAGSTDPQIPMPPDPAKGESGVQWIRKKSVIRIALRQSFGEFFLTWLHEYGHLCSIDVQFDTAKRGRAPLQIMNLARLDAKACESHEARAKAILSIVVSFVEHAGGDPILWR
jgi:RHS repeat-associated protein